MMSPKNFYDISIMFDIDAMICHGHSTKMELAKLKVTTSNGYKKTISPSQSTQRWIGVLFLYSYGWVDIFILVVRKFLRFCFFDFHGLLVLVFLSVLLLLVISLCVFIYELNLCTFVRQTQSSISWIQNQLTPKFNIWSFLTRITNKLMFTNNIQNISNSKCP
jgi:hypothetical protein